MSKFKITDEVIEEVDEKLSFNSEPLFEKSDVECVIFALRSRREGGLAWLQYRARLFENPNIVTCVEGILDGIKKKKEKKVRA